MAITTITQEGAFDATIRKQINDNFTDLANGTGDSFTSPAISGTVTGGASYTAPTLTSPTITGTTAIGAGATITTPTFPTGGTVFTNATSGSITVAPPTGALGTVTVSLPAATDTLIGKATTDTLTNKTIASSSTVPYTAGVAAGYKLARVEIALDGSNPTPWATGLTTIIAGGCSLKGTAAPGVGTCLVTANINSTTLDLYAWKPTGSGDCTLIASTGTESVYAWAVGT